MMLNNADIAMLVLMALAIIVVYFGVVKEGNKVNGTKELDSTCIAKAGLQAFFNICEKWNLLDEHEKVLPGNPTVSVGLLLNLREKTVLN